MEDYKYAVQMMAEEMADKEYGVEFCDLPQEVQIELYRQAWNEYTDMLFAKADDRRKKEREDESLARPAQ